MTTNRFFNRTISVFAAFLVLLCSLTLYSSETGAANTTRSYMVFDAKTGEHLETLDYDLDPLNPPNTTRSVIGTDDRKEDWTKSGTVQLRISDSTGSYIGSGFVVDSHTIATAAHCVYNRNVNHVYLFDADGNIELDATAVEYHIPKLYTTSSFDYDYALITIEEDLSDYMCFNLAVPLDTYRSTVKVTGLPGDLGYMCSATGTVTNISQTKVYYDADTNGGESGGPVYLEETRSNYSYNSVIAIHTHSGNSGTRITTDLIHFYLSNNNLIWETEE